jgi:hypothetical protein
MDTYNTTGTISKTKYFYDKLMFGWQAEVAMEAGMHEIVWRAGP